MVQQEIKYPFGAMRSLSVANGDFADTATITATINNTKSKIFMPTTQNYTLNLQAGAELLAGAEVTVEINQGGTARNITLGAGASAISGVNLAGTINVRQTAVFEWDGTRFVQRGVWTSNTP